MVLSKILKCQLVDYDNDIYTIGNTLRRVQKENAAINIAVEIAATEDNEFYVNNNSSFQNHDLNREAILIVNKAEEQGRIEGIKAGYDHAYSESLLTSDEAVGQIMNGFYKECDNLKEEYSAKGQNAEEGAIAVAMNYANIFTDIVLHSGDEPFIKLFENAASHINEAGVTVLKAGPLGCEIANRHIEYFKSCLIELTSFEIRQVGTDDGLCILATPFGSIDTSVGTQLQKAVQIIGFEHRVLSNVTL
jgi:flagellar biosynthesis/type III secretory pathway protein FliH